MSNPRIEQKLMNKLQNGFVHPGDPEHDIPPTPIVLPFKPSHGQPKEMAELMNKTAKLLAECIVAAIEEDAEIVDKIDALALRKAAGEAGDGPELMPVHCRHCDPTFIAPLAVMTVTRPDRFVVDGPALLRGLQHREPTCPHAFNRQHDTAAELQQTVINTMGTMTTKQIPNKARSAINDAMHEHLYRDVV